jgi:hypothetical protein
MSTCTLIVIDPAAVAYGLAGLLALVLAQIVLR